MAAYVLVGREFESSDVLGVYSSRDAAIAARDKYVARLSTDEVHSLSDYYLYEIYPCVMDAPSTDVLNREVI